MSHPELRIRRPHPRLGAAVRLVERSVSTARRVVADRIDLGHRWFRRLGNRLENPGPPLAERGDWYRFGPLEETPERRELIERLYAQQQPAKLDA
jgi:hypothetical protein